MKKKVLLIIAILALIAIGIFAIIKIPKIIYERKPLAVLKDEDIVIDMTKKIEPTDYLTDIKENVELSYTLDEEKSLLTINAFQGEKQESYQKEVTIVYPTIEVKDDIVIDFNEIEEVNIKDYINVSDNATVDYKLDEEKGHLTITVTDGEYSKTIEKDVEVIPEEKWPKHFVGHWEDDDYDNYAPELYLYKDGTIKIYIGVPGYGSWQNNWKLWKGDDGKYHIEAGGLGSAWAPEVAYTGKKLTFLDNMGYHGYYDLVEE